MSDAPSGELLAAIMATPENALSQDKLDRVRAAAIAAREHEKIVQDLEQRLSDAKALLNRYLTVLLPDLMDEVGVPSIELEAQGNLPAVTVRINPHITAGIAASWPDDKKQLAYKWLDDHGYGDLIKTTITVSFPRDHRAQARDAIEKLKTLHLHPEVKEQVHTGTITSWLKEQIQDHKMPPLDVIGGYVGRKATIKEVKS
jgi:hypothetical protein